MKPVPIRNIIKIDGKNYSLCKNCSDCVNAYIQFSFEPPGFFGRLINKFGAGK